MIPHVTGEFLVNTETADGLPTPTITGLENGGFVVSWSSFSYALGDVSSLSVTAKIFDASGTLVKDEFLVNTETYRDQGMPTITSLENGGFVVSWYDYSGTLGDDSDSSVKAKIFDANGTLVKDEFLVNTETSNYQHAPTITGLENGGFVVSWRDSSGTLGDASSSSIKAKIFDANGALVKDEFLVNTETSNYQHAPTITGLENGGFVVSWRDSSGTLGDASGTSVKAKIFDANGTLVKDEFLVNTETSNYQSAPWVTGLENGGFVVSWQHQSGTLGDASGTSVKAKIFDANGTLVKDEFLVNTETYGSQWHPTITSLENSGFVVSWTDQSGTLGDASGASIKAKIFNANGALVKDEFLVNTETSNHQHSPTITGLENGGFVVSWTDLSGTLGGSTSGTLIKAKVFDAMGDVIVPGSNTGTTGADTFAGTATEDFYYGLGGNDTINGAVGNDTLYGGTGNDRIAGGNGNDSLDGGAGVDWLSGGNGDDKVFGSTGNDRIAGGNGNDKLDGGAGTDWLSGGNGNDIVLGRSGNDTLRGGNQNDRLYGGADDDLIAGNLGDDDLHGGSGNDRMYGGGGDDNLIGGRGTDTLYGGAGSGADVFIFTSVRDSIHGSARDTIMDFDVGVDHIDLSGLGGSLSFVSAYSGTAGEVRYNGSIGRAYVDLDGDGASDFSVDVVGAPALTVDDFILI